MTVYAHSASTDIVLVLRETNNRIKRGGCRREERKGERKISIHRKFGNKKEILFAATAFVKSSVLWAPPGFSFCVDTIRAGEKSRKGTVEIVQKKKAKDKLLLFLFGLHSFQCSPVIRIQHCVLFCWCSYSVSRG